MQCRQYSVLWTVGNRYIFPEFVDRLAFRSFAYRSVPVLPRNARPSPSKGVAQLFPLDEVRQLFSSREQLTALPVHSRPLGVPRQHPVIPIAALAPVFPHTSPAQTGPSDEHPTPEVAAFTNKVVKTPGQHGGLFQQAQPRVLITGTTPAAAAQGPTLLSLTTGSRPQPTRLSTRLVGIDKNPTEPIHPPGVTAPRAEIVNYLRKTNICLRFAFGSSCPRHLTCRCPFVHGIFPEEAFGTANPSPARKSYRTPYVRPPGRLFALTDEAQNLLIAWGITTPSIDHSEKKNQIYGDRTTYDSTHDEDIRALGRDS